MHEPNDLRRFAPAAARNAGPILAVLERVLPREGVLLEIGSGTGEHAAAMAPRFPGIQWQPSDPDVDARASIDAWRAHVGAENICAAATIDAASESWSTGEVDAILAVNVVHISPWSTTVGLFAGAGRSLRPGGVLVLYGPYRIAGRHTAPSNADFDASLRARDPSWGVRDLEALERLAAPQGLALSERVPMPANNFSLLFHRHSVGERGR